MCSIQVILPAMDLAQAGNSFPTACTAAHVKGALTSDKMCSPRPVIVKLPWPNNTHVQQMTPSHVELLQCDGGCHRDSRRCVVTQTREKKVPVMMGRCGIGSGRCDKECADVILEEHIACECACTLSKEICESDTHRYNSDMCKCECKDILDKRECLDQGKTWDESSCKCGCPTVFSCSVGTEYSNSTCACEVMENNSEMKQMKDNRIPRSNNPSFITWEMVIIGILLGIILILFMIIFLLISRLKRMKLIIIRRGARSGEDQEDTEEHYEITKIDIEEINLEASRPVTINDPTYCELDYQSASSGFGSEVSKNDLDDVPDMDNLYASAQNVRLKKRTQAEQIDLISKNSENNERFSFSNAIHSIDETLRLLKESADWL